MSRFWREGIPSEAGATLVELLDLARKGQIKALYLVGENPVGTLPVTSGVREALDKSEFVVCQDLFLTETARMSHVVLPAASFAEQNGHFTNSEGMVQPVRRGFDPIRDSRPDWEIFSQVAGYMGVPFEYGSEDEITNEITQMIPKWKEMPEREALRAAMEQYILKEPSLPPNERYHLGDFQKRDDHGRFWLTMGPTLFHSGKMSLEAEGLRRIANEGLLRISPLDAAQLAVEDGGSVRIRSAQGEVLVKVKIDGRYSSGHVFFPDSFNDPAVKDLLRVEIDPITKAPYFKQTEVDIEKCS